MNGKKESFLLTRSDYNRRSAFTGCKGGGPPLGGMNFFKERTRV
jgi:hypothetical protein